MAHYEDTIQRRVPLSRIDPFVPTALSDRLITFFGIDPIAVWGSTSGPQKADLIFCGAFLWICAKKSLTLAHCTYGQTLCCSNDQIFPPRLTEWAISYMQLADGLYFAPEVKFRELSLCRDTLPSQFGSRIRGYYLNPAKALADESQAFASGLILVSCIDALALIETGLDKEVGLRFVTWVLRYLPSFANIDDAVLLYKDFRNGLVHESRVKNGSQFSLRYEKVVFREDGISVVNPSLLANEVANALQDFVGRLKTEHALWENLTNYVKRSFKREIQLTQEK